MPEYTEILRSLSTDKFAEIFSASSRKSREAYFHRHGIRAPSSGRGFAKPGAKNEVRMAQLYEVLQSTKDEALAEEVLRTWLLTKRPMLAAALDHLKIPHDNGLTESDDVDRFEKLEPAEVKVLTEQLTRVAPTEDVSVYLRYMGTPVS